MSTAPAQLPAYVGLSARSQMEAVLDWKRYRQAKFIGVALLLAAAASLGAAAYISNTLPDYATPDASNQCDLLLAQRTGGWTCPSP